MDDFPSIALPDWELFSQTKRKGQIKTNFESGVVQTRARHTSSKWIFTLGWLGLSPSDYSDLVDFFDSHIGDTFHYTHPTTLVTYTVRFADDVLPEASSVGWNYWKLTGLRLEEV